MRLCLLLFLGVFATILSSASASAIIAQIIEKLKKEVYREAEEKLHRERHQDELCHGIDTRISQEGTSASQHRIFAYTRRQSVNRGRNHRLNILVAVIAAKYRITELFEDKKQRPKIKCDPSYPYRTADGRCTNLVYRSWGQAGIAMRRWLRPEYDDGMMLPRTRSHNRRRPLPSARKVSVAVHLQLKPLTNSAVDQVHSHMLMQWGQFLDHDFTSTPKQDLPEGPDGIISPACCQSLPLYGTRPECFTIKIPPGDSRRPETCMEFVRSVQVENARGKVLPVEQMNEITAPIDASNVYGASEEEQRKLRSFTMGKLLEEDNFLPTDNSPTPSCTTHTPPNRCFKAGDARANEIPTLQSMHTLFVREHNRIAGTLSSLNPQWSDETTFQETRKIVGALMQKITYDEFLPKILGNFIMRIYRLKTKRSGFTSIYKSWADPSIRNAFATAAFRMGHSMIRNSLTSLKPDYSDLAEDRLSDTFGDTSLLLSTNRTVGSYCRGLLTDNVMTVDREMTREVVENLFKDANNSALDLAALNIQRGRDHGLAPYVKWRRFCRVSGRVNRFNQLSTTHSFDSIIRLRSVYRDVRDVDLFTGALSEKPVEGGVVGPTFACLLARQFLGLKRGDRFWFEEGNSPVSFSADQLRELRKASLSRIICDNTDTTRIQRDAFLLGDRISCDELEKVDLSVWEKSSE